MYSVQTFREAVPEFEDREGSSRVDNLSKLKQKPSRFGESRRNRVRELKIHGSTRNKSLVEAFYKLRLCISHDRLLSITTDTANTVIKRYEAENTVCPANLMDELFTTAAVDNIDHNPSSTTANDAYHGTAIPLVQHHSNESTGHERAVDTFDESSHNSSKKLH